MTSTNEPSRDALRAEVRRELLVPAYPATVWRFLSTDAGWSSWWGPGSTIDPQPGGAMHISYPNGQTADGRVLEVEAERRLVFSFGYDREDSPLAVGSSIVEIELAAMGDGTLVQLRHLLPDENAATQHAAGWRYQMGLFAAVIARASLGATVSAQADAWHAAWTVAGEAERRRAFDAVVTPDVTVREPMALLAGVVDLDAWVAQVQQMMPAIVRRTTVPALCLDQATWDWEIMAGDQQVATGRTVARFSADGRMTEVAAFWLTAPPGLATSLVDA